jgi:hypothetical protein
MGIYVSSTGFRLLISKIYDLFLQVDETTTTQRAVPSFSAPSSTERILGNASSSPIRSFKAECGSWAFNSPSAIFSPPPPPFHGVLDFFLFEELIFVDCFEGRGL